MTIRRHVSRLLRRTSPQPQLNGWESEIAFWRRWITTHGDRWPDDYARRMDPVAEVQDPLIIACVEATDHDPVRVLDVGAGPMSIVGSRCGGRALEVTAVDPLAEAYEGLFADVGVRPPVRTVKGCGEDLFDLFEPGTFDVAFASNALDHATDPVLCVHNMARVVRPGGFVVLRHFRHEGETRGYGGLHGWNFDCVDGDLHVWDRHRTSTDVTGPLRAGGHDVHCELVDEFVLVTVRTAGTDPGS